MTGKAAFELLAAPCFELPATALPGCGLDLGLGIGGDDFGFLTGEAEADLLPGVQLAIMSVSESKSGESESRPRAAALDEAAGAAGGGAAFFIEGAAYALPDARGTAEGKDVS